MSLTLTQTDICNVALMKIGQRTIQNISDQTDPNAIACRVGWNLSLGELSREAAWNCLAKVATLAQLPAAPGSASDPIPPPPDPWEPNTNYAVNDLVTYAGQLYQCLIANTSSGSFTVDLTSGYWFETTIFYPNYLGPYPWGNAGPEYQWAYGYRLPNDFILMLELNGINCWDATIGGISGGNTLGSLYEIYQKNLYCDQAQAVIKYTAYETDTTKFDTLFTDCLTLNLASYIATMLRKDDSSLALAMKQQYKKALINARRTNAGESNPRRYNIVSQSRFVASRYRSTNG